MRQTTQKRWMQIAAFPGNRSAAVHARLVPLFPQAVAAPDILHTGLMNVNAILHVANCLANAGRIERGGGYLFYGEGVTPAVARMYEAIDAERMAITTALGANEQGRGHAQPQIRDGRRADGIDPDTGAGFNNGHSDARDRYAR